MGIARTVRRHERALIVAWLVSCALLLGLMGVWGVGMGGAERTIDWWNSRWIPRIERGEELMAAGRTEDAAVYFEKLDADFPALFVKHRLDRERERLLENLGSCYLRLDRKRRTLETFARLVDFDPRNWRNHWLLAEALAHFGENADEAYADVLAIHPNHRPSVEARVTARFEGGRYADVPAPYEAYLDAWLLAQMTLDLGGTSVPLEVVADGSERVVEAPVDLADGWSGELCLRTAGYSVRLVSLELMEPLVVGRAATPATTHLDSGGGWRPIDMHPASADTWAAATPDSALCLADVRAHPTTRVRLTLAVYKAVTPELWDMVEKSYLNALDHEGLEAARARTVVGGCLEGGSIFAE